VRASGYNEHCRCGPEMIGAYRVSTRQAAAPPGFHKALASDGGCKIRPDQAFRRAGFLDFGNQSIDTRPRWLGFLEAQLKITRRRRIIHVNGTLGMTVSREYIHRHSRYGC